MTDHRKFEANWRFSLIPMGQYQTFWSYQFRFVDYDGEVFVYIYKNSLN